jgi:hypothetical protein
MRVCACRLRINSPQPDKHLFDRYRDALDEAVKLATKHNVEPINGASAVRCVCERVCVRARVVSHSLIAQVFVNISDAMSGECAGAKALGGKVRFIDRDCRRHV